MTDVTDQTEVRNERADAFGFKEYEVWHGGKFVARVVGKMARVVDPGYRVEMRPGSRSARIIDLTEGSDGA